jgi:hypothetical protein
MVAIYFLQKWEVKNKIMIVTYGDWWTSCQNSSTSGVKLNSGSFNNNNNKNNSNSVLVLFEPKYE